MADKTKYADLLTQGVTENAACIADGVRTGFRITLDPTLTKAADTETQFFTNAKGTLGHAFTLDHGKGNNINFYEKGALRFLHEPGIGTSDLKKGPFSTDVLNANNTFAAVTADCAITENPIKQVANIVEQKTAPLVKSGGDFFKKLFSFGR